MNKLTKNILSIGSLALLTALYSCDPDTPTPEPDPGVITENAIEWCGNINEPTTWTNHTEGVDYVVTCMVQVKEDFTIEPGTEIVFENNAGFYVTSNALIAKGTAAQPIYFRGRDGLAGEWKGIGVSSNDPANELSYCVVSGGGSGGFSGWVGYEPANLVVNDQCQIKVTNCTFSKSGKYGMFVIGAPNAAPTPFLAYSNNTFKDNTLNPISVNCGTVGQISGMSHTYTDNGEQAIEVRAGRILEDMVWKNAKIPYHIIKKMEMHGGSLTVEAGVEMQFDAGIGLYDGYGDNDFIKFNGTAALPIRLTSFDPADYWDGIYAITRSSQSVMNYVVLDRAGANKMSGASAAGALNVGGFANTSLDLKLNHCTISNSKGYGVTGYNTATSGLVFPTLNDMTYVNNALGDTYLKP